MGIRGLPSTCGYLHLHNSNERSGNSFGDQMNSTQKYGRAFEALKKCCGEEWAAFTEHEFVRRLGDGTLPREAYLHYLRQDYVFLMHFSRAWALAAVKAETIDEIQLAANTLHGLITFEMSLHVETCRKEGMSERELAETKEELENLAYTRYAIDAGLSGDFLDILLTLAPCVLGYGEIGSRLSNVRTSDEYLPWIETYAGEEYQSVCRDLGQMMDGALERRLGKQYQSLPRWNSLSSRFTDATRLEVAFWQMGLRP